MIRRIIKIDHEKCDGCGICVDACHEGAIALINNKAHLVRDDYCDGLGDCLPCCPKEAISFEEREAKPYNEEEVKQNMLAKKIYACPSGQPTTLKYQSCPGNKSTSLKHKKTIVAPTATTSQLNQWPVQIRLVNEEASYFENAKLLIAADCTAYAYASFHQDFMKNHITIIGCPKLDLTDYSEKLTSILVKNNIQSVKIVRMEVPCCGGLEYATIEALRQANKMIPWQVVTISVDGEIID